MPNAMVRHRHDEVEAVDEQRGGGRALRGTPCGVMRLGALCRRLRPSRAARAAGASSASTMKVSTNRTRPSAISDALCTGSAASLNSLASAEAIELPGANSDAADLVRVADDEGHGHRLAQRAAEAQHDAADHADLRVRQHDVPDDFPRRAAEAVGRFLEHRRHDLEHVAHHRSDERNDHDRQDDAGRQHADAVGRALEQRPDEPHVAERLRQHRLHVVAEQRREHEQAPHAVDDRRDRGQQLHRRAERALERRRAHLGEEQRDAEAHRDADQQRDRRRDEGAVDRRQRAEVAW